MLTSLRCCAASLAAVIAVGLSSPLAVAETLNPFEASKWQSNCRGSYTIPAIDIDLGGNLAARQGYPSPFCGIILGASAGVALDSGPSVNSSSAFYRGGTDTFGAPYVNVFANVPITTLGPFAVRFGGMIETMPGTFNFSGTAGGVPTTSSGALWQTDFLATLPLVTPISQNFLFAVTPVVGIGLLKPTGNPGGPFFTGTDTAVVVGIDLSVLQPVSPNVVVMYNVGYRHTAPTSFNTTLVGERYNIGGSDKIMASLSLLFQSMSFAPPPEGVAIDV